MNFYPELRRARPQLTESALGEGPRQPSTYSTCLPNPRLDRLFLTFKPFNLPTCNGLPRQSLSPLFATHPRNRPLSPFLATHPKTRSRKFFVCHTRDTPRGFAIPGRPYWFPPRIHGLALQRFFVLAVTCGLSAVGPVRITFSRRCSCTLFDIIMDMEHHLSMEASTCYEDDFDAR